jgi:hypothetical protein
MANLNDFKFKKKMFSPCTREIKDSNRRCRLWIEIEISKNHITKGLNGPEIPNTGYDFSMCGNEGMTKDGNIIGACGQIDTYLKKENRNKWKYINGFNDEFMDKILEIWDKYNLKNIDKIPKDVVSLLNKIPDGSPCWY